VPQGGRPPALPPPIWFVGAIAAASAFLGSFFCLGVAAALHQAVTIGNMGFGPPRGLNGFVVALLFGVPTSGATGAALAYLIVVTRRRPSLGFLAVGAGTFSGALVGWGNVAIADWWVDAVSSSGVWGWAEITALPTFLVVATVLLSGRVVLEMVPTTMRSRLVFLVATGALLGLVVGMLIGGEVGYFSSFQSPCPPYGYGGDFGGGCIGSGPGPGLTGGWFLGSWLGTLVGVVTGALLWAVPPPIPDRPADERAVESDAMNTA
jgi:hypothetical protein